MKGIGRPKVGDTEVAIALGRLGSLRAAFDGHSR